MLGDIFKSPVLGELRSPSSVFDFRWSVGSLGSLGSGSQTSPQVPEKVEKTPGPVIKVGPCKCCSGNGNATFDEDLLDVNVAGGPSFRVSNINDVMQHWADVDGDFLKASPTPGTSKAPNSQTANPLHSPADDLISEMLNDMEQFGQTNGVDHLWLNRVTRARQTEKSLENAKNVKNTWESQI